MPSVHLGLAYLSGFLKYSGHKVKIIDANAQPTNYEELYDTAFNYDVIGFSIYSTNLISTKQAIKKLRVNGYNGHITLGGHLVSLCPQHLLEIPGANSIVIGEGEITLNDLIYSIKNKIPIDKVKGLAIKNKNRLLFTPPRALIKDLNFDFFPDRTYYEKYLKKYKFTSISSSRGCNGCCSFCSISQFYSQSSGPKWRARSAENVLKEIEHLYLTYKINDFMFVDDNFIPNKASLARAFDMAKGIREISEEIIFGIEFRPDNIYDGFIPKLSKNSLHYIYVGLESVIPRQQKLYNKKINPNVVKQLIKQSNLSNVYPTVFTIFIDPWVTPCELKQNLDFVKEVGPEYFHDISSYLRPIPGTPLYDYIKGISMLDIDHPMVPGSRYYINTKFANNSIIDILNEWLSIRDDLENKFSNIEKKYNREQMLSQFRILKNLVFEKCYGCLNKLF
jgi:radical SAM superfamily enzyme YgiQ (UPF0313 family)